MWACLATKRCIVSGCAKLAGNGERRTNTGNAGIWKRGIYWAENWKWNFWSHFLFPVLVTSCQTWKAPRATFSLHLFNKFRLFKLQCNSKTSNNYWTTLSKISWFVSGEQINYYLWHTDKSRYFAIAVFNNCFIIPSPIFFINDIFGKRSDLPFFTQEGEKRGFVYEWAEYYLQPNTVGRYCAWADHYL